MVYANAYEMQKSTKTGPKKFKGCPTWWVPGQWDCAKYQEPCIC